MEDDEEERPLPCPSLSVEVPPSAAAAAASLAGRGEEGLSCGASGGPRRGGGDFGGVFGDENLVGVVSVNTGGGFGNGSLAGVVSVDTGGGFSDETLTEVVPINTGGGFSNETLAGVFPIDTGGGFGDETLAGVVSVDTGGCLSDENLAGVGSVNTGGRFSYETPVGVVSVDAGSGFSDETLAGAVSTEITTEESDNDDDYNDNSSNNNSPSEEQSPPFGIAVVVQDHLQYLLISSSSHSLIDSPPSEEQFPPDSSNRPFGLAIFMHGRLQNLLIGFSPPNPTSPPPLGGEPTDRPLALALTFSDSQPGGDLQVLSSADLLAELFRYLSERETTTGFSSSSPASKSAIKTMPAIHITRQTPGLGDLRCAICLENFEIGNITKQMPCKHIYHPGCILPWLELHSSCPICRTEMPSDDDELSLNSHSEIIEETSTRSSSNSDFGLDPFGGMSSLHDYETTQFQPELESDTTSSEYLGWGFEGRRPLAQTRVNSESSNGSFIDASGPRILPSQHSREQNNLQQQSSVSTQSESSSGSQRNFSFWPFRRRSYPQETRQLTSLGGNSSEGLQQRPFWERGWWEWVPGL